MKKLDHSINTPGPCTASCRRKSWGVLVERYRKGEDSVDFHKIMVIISLRKVGIAISQPINNIV